MTSPNKPGPKPAQVVEPRADRPEPDVATTVPAPAPESKPEEKEEAPKLVLGLQDPFISQFNVKVGETDYSVTFKGTEIKPEDEAAVRTAAVGSGVKLRKIRQ